MFDRVNVHIIITLAWLIMFALLWWVLQAYFLNVDALAMEISDIEKNIQDENWTQATANYQRLKKLWDQKRIGLQFNNGTQVVGNFELELAQIGAMINHKQKDAIQFIGGLKQNIKTISTVFPGP